MAGPVYPYRDRRCDHLAFVFGTGAWFKEQEALLRDNGQIVSLGEECYIRLNQEPT